MGEEGGQGGPLFSSSSSSMAHYPRNSGPRAKILPLPLFSLIPSNAAVSGNSEKREYSGKKGGFNRPIIIAVEE